MKYEFIRDDNGSVVEVDFATMMTKDAQQRITLPDGTRATQVKSENRLGGTTEHLRTYDAWARPLESYTLGFPEQQLKEMAAHRDLYGLTGIEFKRDPKVPEFYNVHASCKSQWDKYVQARCTVNKSGSISSKVHLSEKEIARLQDLVNRKLGDG